MLAFNAGRLAVIIAVIAAAPAPSSAGPFLDTSLGDTAPNADPVRLSLLTTSATSSPTALELGITAASIAAGAAEGGFQGAIDAFAGPTRLLPAGMALMALGGMAQRSGFNAGASNFLFGLFYWAGAIAIPVSYVMPFVEGRDQRVPSLETSWQLDTRIYLLTYDKKSPLTGAFAREPSGLGIGYDWSFGYSHPNWGLLLDAALTWQQSDIDSNDFIEITAFFMKADLRAGVDLMRPLGTITGVDWIKRQRLAVQIGPSFFRNWIWLTETGGFFVSRPRDAELNVSLGLAEGVGYELVGELDVDLGIIGGFKVIGQLGSFPSLKFPELRGRDAGLVALVGFDDLRAGEKYEWRRLTVVLNIPFVGFAKDGALTVGGQLSELQAGTGASVNNRGLSLGGTWRW